MPTPCNTSINKHTLVVVVSSAYASALQVAKIAKLIHKCHKGHLSNLGKNLRRLLEAWNLVFLLLFFGEGDKGISSPCKLNPPCSPQQVRRKKNKAPDPRP